jgi:phosphatidylserine synthase
LTSRYRFGSLAELLVSVGACAALLAALALLLLPALGLSASFLWRALVAFAIGCALLVPLARTHLRDRRFGTANRVTLARGALTALIAALLGEETRPSLAWAAVVVASLVLLLDGVDGWVARRAGTTGAFGARFDMETDALLILT